ncbi:MAG: alpha/beta hydrolase [Alphaproteobacteria bacterium]|nr:alpha/beta hydrolase [Alphaproteobacteria bacterium]
MTQHAPHPPMPPATRIDVGEVTLSVHLAGPENGVPVLLLHGWPELALSWAQQIQDLSEAGYRVIAPDNRGFGASDAPPAVEAYGVDHLIGDMTGLLDALGIEKAVIAGHDWGGILMWHAACLVPERFIAAIGVNTPHLPRGAQPPTEVFRERGGDEHYIVRLQDEAMDDLFAGQEEDFFAFTFGAPVPSADLDKLPASITHLPSRFEKFVARGGLKSEEDCVVPQDIRARYAEAYRRSGFRGGFNWYRNFDANWERMGGVDHRLSMPVLMITAECDFMLPPKLAGWMPALCSDLTMEMIEGIGHWTQYEAPAHLSALMLAWLEERFPAR